MLDLIRKASGAVRAEHAVVNGVHSSKGCHGCALWAEFRKYVLEVEQSYPMGEVLVSSCVGGKTRFAIWVSEPLTHQKWEILRRYLDLLEPDASESEPPKAPLKAVEVPEIPAPSDSKG